MYSSSDFERLFIRYKADSMPRGESIQDFCLKNKVPYNLFQKWYKDTRHSIVPVQVAVPMDPESGSSPCAPVASLESPLPSGSVQILIDIRMSNGLHIQQRNLSYQGLKSLVEKLEVLC